MPRDLTILTQASAMMRHAAARHTVVAENIANADTPGYKARALPRFDPDLGERAARGDQAAAARLSRPYELRDVAVAPNGNSVELDVEIARAVDAQAQHGAALQIYRKTLELLRTAGSPPR